MVSEKTKRENRVKQCIFCGSEHLSAEHIWPKWMHSLLRKEKIHRRNVAHHTVGGVITGLISNRARTRDGAVITKRLRVVCARCNNTWMSGIEADAKPILTSLITGEKGILTADMQRKVAVWMALKTMIGEHPPFGAVITQAERTEFKNSKLIPPFFHIWIGRCFSRKWQSAWLRTAGTIGAYTENLPKVLPEGVNIQTTTLGAGELFLYSRVLHAPDVQLDNEAISEHLVPIYPEASPDLRLPNRFIVSDKTADNIANHLNIILRSGAAAEYADDGTIITRSEKNSLLRIDGAVR